MVDVWGDSIDKGIRITKYRIKHLEKHGNGTGAMQEKEILKRQLRNKELRDARMSKRR